MVCFAKTKRRAYSAENMKSLSPAELVEVIVSVAFEITKFKIDFVTGAEKKLKNFSVDIRGIFAKNPSISLEECLNLAFYQTVVG